MAPVFAKRPDGQARPPSIPTVCKGGATTPDGLFRETSGSSRRNRLTPLRKRRNLTHSPKAECQAYKLCQFVKRGRFYDVGICSHLVSLNNIPFQPRGRQHHHGNHPALLMFL